MSSALGFVVWPYIDSSGAISRTRNFLSGDNVRMVLLAVIETGHISSDQGRSAKDQTCPKWL